MGNFKVEIAKIVGTPSPTSWAQTLVQNNFYLVLEISGSEDVVATGKNLLDTIELKLQANKKQNLAFLKELVGEVLASLSPNYEVNLVLVKKVEEVAYLVIRGEGKVFLKREKSLETILIGKKKEIIGGSGFLKKGDLLILATSKFAKLISKEELRENLNGFVPSEIAERFAPKIHESTEGSGVACIILSFDSEVMEKTFIFRLPTLNLNLNLNLNRRLFLLIPLVILIVSIILGIRERANRQKKEEIIAREMSVASSPSLQTFFDLTLIKENGTGSKVAFWDEEVAILDKENNNVYNLSLANKSSKIVGANLKSPELITTDLDNIYVLGEEGIYKIQKKDGTATPIIKKDDSSTGGFGEIAGMATFLSNIYLLDKKNSTIYKYTPSGETYLKKSYFPRDIKPDFSKAVSLSIDGEVYVLLEDGTVLKYFQGAPKNFKISGLEVPFSNPRAIFTAQNFKNIYILDIGNKRVVVLDKEGNYKSQYQGIEDVQDLVVSESGKKIFLLSGSKIYSIAISD